MNNLLSRPETEPQSGVGDAMTAVLGAASVVPSFSGMVAYRHGLRASELVALRWDGQAVNTTLRFRRLFYE